MATNKAEQLGTCDNGMTASYRMHWHPHEILPTCRNWRAIEESRSQPDDYKSKLAQSTNYVADDEVFPTKVTFANGRTVAIANRPEGPFLTVGLESRSQPEPLPAADGTATLPSGDYRGGVEQGEQPKMIYDPKRGWLTPEDHAALTAGAEQGEQVSQPEPLCSPIAPRGTLQCLRDAINLIHSEANRWESADPKTYQHWKDVAAILSGNLLAETVRLESQSRGVEESHTPSDRVEYWKSRATTAELKVLTFHEEIGKLNRESHTPQAPLTFQSFAEANRRRCEAPNGFNHQLASWSMSDWFTATLGELGEAANVAKKLNRVRDGIRGNKESTQLLQAKLRQELGDAFVYLDLLAQSLGFNIGEAAQEVFATKSKEIGYEAGARVETPKPEGK